MSRKAIYDKGMSNKTMSDDSSHDPDRGRSVLMDHYKNPRHQGLMTDPELHAEIYNPKCGDRLVFSAYVDRGVVHEIRFEGEGCFYCLVSASVACEIMSGKAVSDIRKNVDEVRSWLTGKGDNKLNEKNHLTDIPEINALGEVKKYPMRIDCVDLAWKGLEKLLNSKANQTD